MNLRSIQEKARILAKGACRVCRNCDGVACAGEVPGMGGVGTASGFKDNIAALAAIHLNMRIVHHVRSPRTETYFLGFRLALPLIIAPIGGIPFNMGNAMAEDEYQKAISKGAKKAGIVAALPDSAPMEVIETSLKCASELQGHGIIFIKPWEEIEFNHKMDLCAEAGCRVIGCDIDSAGLITLRKMKHPAFAKSPEELATMIRRAHDLNMKFIVKGILNTHDAVLCMEAGADAIVVSNHGGRVLDYCPPAAQMLPEIRKCVGRHMAVMADGGVRSGLDILKLLALGADCVMIGRPYAVAAVGGGQEGVELYTHMYKEQLEQAMIMSGCSDVRDAGHHLLYEANGHC